MLFKNLVMPSSRNVVNYGGGADRTLIKTLLRLQHIILTTILEVLCSACIDSVKYIL